MRLANAEPDTPMKTLHFKKENLSLHEILCKQLTQLDAVLHILFSQISFATIEIVIFFIVKIT
jgi:hypothetical protein